MRIALFSIVLGGLFLAMPSARATEPLLDCTAGTVDEVICKNSELLALHQRIITTVNKAIDKLDLLDNPDAAAALEEQIIGAHDGWLASRMECLKAINPPHGECLKEMYAERLAELDAEWGLIPPSGPGLNFACKGMPYKATFYESTRPSLALDDGENRTIFVAKPAETGVKYEGPFGQYFWIKGNRAEYLGNVNAEPIDCYASIMP